jgi:DNA-binding Lrp family transcriptional regulator
MQLAFVMINVRAGKDRDVVHDLKRLKGVREVYEVYAVYDILAIVETETMEELNDLVNSRMRKIENITSTHTVIAERFK